MKRKLSIILIICLVVLIGGAVLFFQPIYISFDMPCMEMTAEGEELGAGQLVLTGLQYQDLTRGMVFTRFVPFELQIPEYQGYVPLYDTPPSVADSVPPGCLTCFFFVRDGGLDVTSCHIVWHEDRSCCVVYVDGRFFVGSRTGDYEAALELFHSVLYVGD